MKVKIGVDQCAFRCDDMQQALHEVQAIFQHASIGIALTRDRRVLRCNKALADMFGHPQAALVGNVGRLIFQSDEAYDQLGEASRAMIAAGQPFKAEHQFVHRDGSRVLCAVSASAVEPRHPEWGTIWLFDDVTRERQQQAELSVARLENQALFDSATLGLLENMADRRASEAALLAVTTLNQIVFDSAGAAIIATDTRGVIQLFNAAAERMLGYDAQELVYLQTPAALHDLAEVVDYAQQLTQELGELVTPGFDVFCIKARLLGKDEREWTYISKSGQRIPVVLCVTALRAASGHITGYLGIATDITERRAAQLLVQQSNDELETKVLQRTAELAETNARLQTEVAERTVIERQMRDMAHFDPVTGLPNRNLLRDRMTQALLQGKRDNTQVAVMFLDLDRFKNINDTLGHLVGDDLLRLVAVRLSMALRTSDTLARIGGDEFVLILPSLTTSDHVDVVAGKLTSALQAPMEVQGHLLHITTSIGICIYPQDGADTDVLLRNADTAMYQAKAAGRNTFRFFTERMNQEAERHYRIESALRTGVRDNELRLLFQPLIDMRSNRIFGVEALVRWQSPILGLVMPGQFIPIAEETDLIVGIDSWVFRQACEQAAQWRRQGFADLTLAVNLSARQFRRKDLVAFVAEVLQQTGYPAHLLELEITESSLMHNVTEVIQTLDQLVALGVKLAIDDFGTGYSSLAYLKRFPVHKLKIDQSFVRDIGQADSDLAIVKTVIALAQTLRLELLAEGVETQTHLMTLRALGCERFQGYLFSKPVDAAQIEQMLNASATSLLPVS